jgi:hypothetical protein
MAIETFTVVALACDACGTPLVDHDDAQIWFRDLLDARRTASTSGWITTQAGDVVCPGTTQEHRDAVAALLPPEPVIEVEGQLALDDQEEADR